MRPLSDVSAPEHPVPADEWVEELVKREVTAWHELVDLVESLSEEEAARPGYYPDAGWSAKDALAHIGSWLAEAGVMLERIRGGTYQPDDVDIDTLNQTFFENERDVEYRLIRVQCWASRTRMLGDLGVLKDGSPYTLWWVEKAGPDHYEEHLPRLREWVAELRAVT
jgi:hypothetical protein